MGDGEFLLEGRGSYVRCGGLDPDYRYRGFEIVPNSLGMLDFDGGPFYSLGDTYYPGPDDVGGTVVAKDNCKIIGIFQVDTTDPTYFAFKIVTKKVKDYRSPMEPIKSRMATMLEDLRCESSHRHKALLETLAKLEHDQWMEWAQTLMAKEKLSPDRVQRWQKFMLPYEDLPEDVKEFDRVWARKAMVELINAFPIAKMEELLTDNENLEQILMQLKVDIVEMEENYRKTIESLEKMNTELKSIMASLQTDVHNLFTAQLDKGTIARYSAPLTEQSNNG